MIKVRFAGIAGLLAAGAVCAGLIVPAFSASPTKPVISQEASAAMMQMGQTLRSQALLVSGEDAAGLCGH